MHTWRRQASVGILQEEQSVALLVSDSHTWQGQFCVGQGFEQYTVLSFLWCARDKDKNVVDNRRNNLYSDAILW